MSGDGTQSPGRGRGMGAPRMRDASRVLIVESIRSTRELMALVLERYYRTQTAATYEQALRRVQSNRFDGIVMSVNLRGVEAGVEMLEVLRSLEAYETVPIVVIIGPSVDEGREQLSEAGGDGFLRMPFVRSELVETLQQHVKTRQKEGRDRQS